MHFNEGSKGTLERGGKVHNLVVQQSQSRVQRRKYRKFKTRIACQRATRPLVRRMRRGAAA